MESWKPSLTSNLNKSIFALKLAGMEFSAYRHLLIKIPITSHQLFSGRYHLWKRIISEE